MAALLRPEGLEIKSKSNSKQIVFPRQVAMYVLKKLTELSFPK